MTSAVQQAVLDRLAAGPATLAGLRAALPADDVHARALMSMGEPDPFGEEVASLVRDGVVLDEQGVYRLPGAAPGTAER